MVRVQGKGTVHEHLLRECPDLSLRCRRRHSRQLLHHPGEPVTVSFGVPSCPLLRPSLCSREQARVSESLLHLLQVQSTR